MSKSASKSPLPRIGIRELKNKTSKIVREIREQEAEYVITHQGRPVAVLSSYDEEEAERERRLAMQASIDDLKRMSRQVTDAWTSPKSGLELLDEQRR